MESLTVGDQGPFAVIAEMLDSLETLTSAGQRHTMVKVLAFLAPRVHERQPLSGTEGGDGMEGLLEELGREVRRPLPGAQAFRDRAQMVLGALCDHGTLPTPQMCQSRGP